MNQNDLTEYRSVYRISFIATIAMLVIIPLQIVVFVITKIPTTTVSWFELFNKSFLLGFFHADLFILINNILISIIYLSFYHSLKDINKGLLQIALLLGFIGISAYISSNKTFELLSLSNQYYLTNEANTKMLIEAAGKSVLLGWQGTAFDTYYVLNGITLLIISLLMYKSKTYDKTTATFGLSSAILMTIPSTAGKIGIVFSLLSLVPWYVFSIRFAVVFNKLGKKI
jgi:hypothetical protein